LCAIIEGKLAFDVAKTNAEIQTATANLSSLPPKDQEFEWTSMEIKVLCHSRELCCEPIGVYTNSN